MELIIFSITLTFIIFFLGLKIWEDKRDKSVFSEEFFRNSDRVLSSYVIKFRKSCNLFFEKRNDVPRYIVTILGWLFKELMRIRNFLVSRIVKILKLHNVKKIQRDKGSASLFLRSISENKSDDDEKGCQR